MTLLKAAGHILFIWFLWSMVFFFIATLGNPEANYKKIFYILLTNLASMAACYLYIKYLMNNDP